jgi:regulator of cell morphogenesis and NO signaling
MNYIAEQTLASIVTSNHEAVPVLERYNLDFCCKGKRTLAQACAEKGIKIESITEELKFLSGIAGKQQMPFTEMDVEQLVNYIIIHHHFYVKRTMPTIAAHLQKIVAKHGDKFPFMQKVDDLFGLLVQTMRLHMDEEEKVVFPRIKKAETLFKDGKFSESPPGYTQDPIHVLEADHEEAGDIMYQIRTATNTYTPPQGACTTFRITLAELKEFEEDLHKHVHIENNILFPKATQYECNK